MQLLIKLHVTDSKFRHYGYKPALDNVIKRNFHLLITKSILGNEILNTGLILTQSPRNKLSGRSCTVKPLSKSAAFKSDILFSIVVKQTGLN
jgi:hypothetical protein